MALFGHGSGLVTELLTLAVLMAHFGHYIANFDGVPSELSPGGSSDGTLLTVVELQTFAVLMALFSHAISWSANCVCACMCKSVFVCVCVFVDKTPG